MLLRSKPMLLRGKPMLLRSKPMLLRSKPILLRSKRMLLRVGIFKEWLVKYFFVHKIVFKAILVF